MVHYNAAGFKFKYNYNNNIQIPVQIHKTKEIEQEFYKNTKLNKGECVGIKYYKVELDPSTFLCS